MYSRKKYRMCTTISLLLIGLGDLSENVAYLSNDSIYSAAITAVYRPSRPTDIIIMLFYTKPITRFNYLLVRAF